MTRITRRTGHERTPGGDPRLRAFGTHVHTFGVSNVGATGRATRVEAGQTADMHGLLDVIAPAIHETAVVLGNH